MKHTFKRIVSLALTLTMVGSLLNVAVLATAPDSAEFAHRDIICTAEGCDHGMVPGACGTCGGSGKVETPSEVEGETEEVDCTLCGGTGERNYVCNDCGGDGKLDCTGTYEAIGYIGPNCTEGGYTIYTCSGCGGEEHQYDSSQPTGHTFDVVGEPCTDCKASYYVDVIFNVTMPNSAKQAYPVPVKRGSGTQYVELLDTLKADESMGWQSSYSISSFSVNTDKATLVYAEDAEHPGKINELSHGVTVKDVGEDDIVIGDIIVTSGRRNMYWVYNYKEAVDGSWTLTAQDMEQYAAVNLSTAAGLGPVYGETYTVSPKEIEGYTPYYYGAALWVYWNGLLNSGNYTAEYPQGGAKYIYDMDMATLDISLDAASRVFTGTAKCMESDFFHIFVYYYSMLRPVTYHANNDTDDTTSTGYLASDTVTVAGNTFTRSGYTFDGWNTEPDGSGTDYAVDDTFTMGYVEGLDLYAQWTAAGADPILPPDTNPTPADEDPTTPPEEPVEQPAEEPENIPQEEVPATQTPVADKPVEEVAEESVEEIVEEEPPMAEAPKTGDSIFLWLTMAALSGMGLVAMAAVSLKRKENEA